MLLKRIDELTVFHYPYLRPEDEIYYLGEYTTGKLASFSPMNQLILNYKKEIDRKNKPEWHYKEQAIDDAATYFESSIFQTKEICDRAKYATLVPIPPSVAKNSPKHDDRNLKLLQKLMPKGDIRELLIQKESRQPLHLSKKPRNPKDLENNYIVNAPSQVSEIKEIWLFDDVLTKGTHFRAAHNLLQQTFPSAKIVGFFIARSIYPSTPLVT